MLPDERNVTLFVTAVNSGYGLGDGLNAGCNRQRGYIGMDDGAVARRIALARLGRGWTQRELGEKLGKTADSVKQMETGRGIGRDTLEELARALGVSFGYLAAGITQPPDIDVLVEGARQSGWDECVARMRDSLDRIKRSARTPHELTPNEAGYVSSEEAKRRSRSQKRRGA